MAGPRVGHQVYRPGLVCVLGQFCTEDVDECQLQPNACHNGGTCFNTLGSHSCVCVNGWTGESCSQNIDDCATAVCFHGATCHDRVASFYCACPMGKTGEWLSGPDSTETVDGSPVGEERLCSEHQQPGVVAHAYLPSIWEAEAGRFL